MTQNRGSDVSDAPKTASQPYIPTFENAQKNLNRLSPADENGFVTYNAVLPEDFIKPFPSEAREQASGDKTHPEDVLLSVIIPIYNCEPFLRVCVESVNHALTHAARGQHKVEVLLIDDGSTDHSGQLADELAKEAEANPQIIPTRVIHQQNGGLSAARNTGLMAARGDFIFFLDADDRFRSHFMHELVVNLATPDTESLDAFVLSYANFNDGEGEGGHGFGLEKVETLGRQDAAFSISRHNLAAYLMESSKQEYTYYQIAWRYIVRRSFLLEHELYFVEGLLHEDEEWTSRLMTALSEDGEQPRMAELQPWLYAYRRGRAGAITGQVTRRHVAARLKIFESQMQVMEALWQRTEAAGGLFTTEYTDDLVHRLLGDELSAEERLAGNRLAALSYLRGRIAHNLRSVLMFGEHVEPEEWKSLSKRVQDYLRSESNSYCPIWARSEMEFRRWVPWLGLRFYAKILQLGHRLKAKQRGAR